MTRVKSTVHYYSVILLEGAWEHFFYDMQNSDGKFSSTTFDKCSGNIVIGLTAYGWCIVTGSLLSGFTSYSLMWIGIHCNKTEIVEQTSIDEIDMVSPHSEDSGTTSDDNMAEDAADEASVTIAEELTNPINVCREMVVCCNCIEESSAPQRRITEALGTPRQHLRLVRATSPVQPSPSRRGEICEEYGEEDGALEEESGELQYASSPLGRDEEKIGRTAKSAPTKE